jgi:hypothetical protein
MKRDPEGCDVKGRGLGKTMPNEKLNPISNLIPCS